MTDLLNEIRASTPDTNLFLGTKAMRKWTAWLESTPDDATPIQVAHALKELGIAELRLGFEKQAVNHLGRSFQICRENKAPRELSGEALFFLGVAYLRFAETQNCCQLNTPESCILPLRGSAIHAKPEGAQNAMTAFQVVLQILPQTDPRYHSARWLLNVAAMTLGKFPDAVPEPHRVLPERIQGSGSGFPEFPNIAGKLGLDSFNLAGGAIVDDFNNDGYLDILTSTWDVEEAMVLFINRADGTFEKVCREAGLAEAVGGLNLVQADYNNDGFLDVLVLRGAWLADAGRHPNSLLRNDGPDEKGVPHFTDVTFEVGLGKVHYPTQTASWADYDLDGDLDLYVGNETTETIIAPNQLFRNDGGRFIDVAVAAGVENFRFSKGVIWGDYDNDRYPDLYVSNMNQLNRLYHNKGDGTFEDVTDTLGVAGTPQSFPVWFWDVDNDGALDLFSSFYSPDAGFTASHYFGFQMQDRFLPGLYRNDGNGSFENQARQAGLNLPIMPMGCNFGDLNNDGWLDFFLGTGNVGLEHVTPNLMFVNQNGNRFENVTLEGRFGHLQKGHSIAFADLDNDGDLDIFAQMGGAFPADKYFDSLYENPGFNKGWLGVELIGDRSSRCAIGARIKAEFKDGGALRSVYRHVNSGGSFGANPLRQWIGLNKAIQVERLEVYWPVTGETQSFINIPGNRTIRIMEGSDAFETLTLKKFVLGSDRI